MYFHPVVVSSNSKSAFITAGLILLILISGRGYFALGDFSYFFVAGTDFVDASATPAPVWVQQGQGYDGQFFYRYALDPFNFSKEDYGVTVDLVPYRVQRIGYPLLCWLFSFGGIPWLVPYSMVLINVLAFFGILYFVNRLNQKITGKLQIVYQPLLLCGLYMSVARSLSEVTELFFITGALCFIFEKRFLLFALFASFAILIRETSIIALFPFVCVLLYSYIKNKSVKPLHLYMVFPFIVFFIWKIVIASQTDSIPGASGTGNIGMPFKGMIMGFFGNTDISTLKNKLQLSFWILYFLWQLVLIILVVKEIFRSFNIFNNNFFAALAVSWLCWLLFAIFLSSAIYVDDWSFVRVFSLWNMVGMLLLLLRNYKLPTLFRYYSFLLVALTLVRLIIRP